MRRVIGLSSTMRSVLGMGAGAGVVTEITEHHADDIDRGAEGLGDAGVLAIVARLLEGP